MRGGATFLERKTKSECQFFQSHSAPEEGLNLQKYYWTKSTIELVFIFKKVKKHFLRHNIFFKFIFFFLSFLRIKIIRMPEKIKLELITNDCCLIMIKTLEFSNDASDDVQNC